MRAPKDALFQTIQKIKIQNAVEDMSWFKDEVFVAINQIGKIYLFEKSAGDKEWKSVYEVKDATSYGTTVSIADDGKTVFAGTSTEVIQFEVESEAVGSISLSGVKKIFPIGNDVFALTNYGFVQLKRTTIKVNPDLIKYKYFKIGVVGHTGVGKSTLCNRLTTGTFSDLSSTPGKKIWNWELPKDNGQEKRLILHDHGGQETVLSTFLPFLLDSDIILILWQQTDGTTLKKALQICDQLLPKIADNTKVFFVQTFADEKMAEFDDKPVEDLIKNGAILDNLKVSSKSGKGIEELKESLLKQISWDNAPVIVQTASGNGVLKTIIALQEQNITGISFEDFMSYYVKETALGISKAHLKLLLRDYGNQGIIEYNPEILDLVIINDPEYNQLKTDIPIFVMKKGGVVSISELVTKFKNNRFLPIIDAMYLKYRVAIENFEQRIFPELLRAKPIAISDYFSKYLKETPTDTRVLNDQQVSMERLFEALSEQKLRCISASKLSGLFSWEENAIVFYNFDRVGNFFDGFSIHCDFRIGGSKKLIVDRLKQEFVGIIERLFGPSIEAKEESDKKKVEIGDKYVHDVAISYASEQGDFAGKVAEILTSNGVRVFFDKYFKTKMWGKELAPYLQRVYRDESRYCLMFISKEYVSKAWPTYELKCAISRSIASMGEYILPIRFDDSEVPGLSTTMDYIRAKRYTADQLQPWL